MTTIERIRADLSKPAAYPGPVGQDGVQIEETHASLVFLAGEFVYKVKKPVDFGFLDFSTLEKRLFCCREELRLNRRLTDDVYLDVVPIVEGAAGLRIGAMSEWNQAVEYAVKMRRLPQERILGQILDDGFSEGGIFPALFDRLAAFYQTAATGEGIDEWGTPRAVLFNIDENVEQTRPYLGRVIAPVQLELIERISHEFVEGQPELFARRLANGKIREGHGDLHLKHIWIGNRGERPDDIQIIDCIDFNPRLRCGDIAVDLAFLAMDLRFRNWPGLDRMIASHMARKLKDADLPRLIHFFSIYRAHVRNKVACFTADAMQPGSAAERKLLEEAERYIDLATSYMVETKQPTLIVVGGLPATGKSVLARRIGHSLGIPFLNSDITRKELAGRAIESHDPQHFEQGIYQPKLTERTYQAMLDRARIQLNSGRSVVLDATFLDPKWREAARGIATTAGAGCLLVETRARREVVQERLARRAAEGGDPSEAHLEVYEGMRARFGETIQAVASMDQLAVDAERPLALSLNDVLAHLSLSQRL